MKTKEVRWRVPFQKWDKRVSDNSWSTTTIWLGQCYRHTSPAFSRNVSIWALNFTMLQPCFFIVIKNKSNNEVWLEAAWLRLYNSTLSPINPIYDQNKNHQGKEQANWCCAKMPKSKRFCFWRELIDYLFVLPPAVDFSDQHNPFGLGLKWRVVTGVKRLKVVVDAIVSCAVYSLPVIIIIQCVDR